jgi:hypothetical protein
MILPRVRDPRESAQPMDPRPRQAIEHARAWVRGEVTMTQARAAGGHAMGAARGLRGPARHAAYGAGEAAGRRECRWQRDQLPEAIRELVHDDQRLRNDICWSVFNR